MATYTPGGNAEGCFPLLPPFAVLRLFPVANGPAMARGAPTEGERIFAVSKFARSFSIRFIFDASGGSPRYIASVGIAVFSGTCFMKPQRTASVVNRFARILASGPGFFRRAR